MKLYLQIILSLILLCTSLEAQNIQLVFRYDDFMLGNDSVNDSVLTLFQRLDIPLVLGVIPCDEHENFVIDKDYKLFNKLKSGVRSGKIEIALHGLTHKRNTPYGEFKGLSLAEQSRMIRKGKNFLDSVFQCQVISFIPPWNSHDQNTVKALTTNGISIVSSSVYDVWTEKTFYPLTTDDFYQLEIIVNNNQVDGGVVVLMFHGYDFKNKNSWLDFEKILQNLKANPKVSFYTFKSLRQAGVSITIDQTTQLKHKNLLAKIFRVDGIFLSTFTYNLIRILNSLLYLLIGISAFVIWQRFILKKYRYRLPHYVLFFTLGMGIGAATFFYVWGPLKLLVIMLLVVFALPFVFQFSDWHKSKF